MKKILMPLMLALLVLGWHTTLKSLGAGNRLLEQHLTQAQVYEEKGIYIDALDEYKSALEYTKDPYPLHLKIMDMYGALKRNADFVDYGEMLLEEYDYQEDVVIRLVDYYRGNQKKRYAIDVLNRAVSRQADNQVYIRQLAELRGTYTSTYLGKDRVCPYYLQYAVFEKNEKVGLLNTMGVDVIRAVYDEITPYGNSPQLATVRLEQEWYCIDKNGYKKKVPDRPVEALGMYGEDLIAFKADGLYGYMDSEMNVVQEPCWAYAGVFSGGVAPVSKDGKWNLVNTDFQPILSSWLDDIVVSEYGVATEYGVFFGRQSETYYLFDLAGTKLEPDGFEAVRQFASEQPAAVCRDGLWGYVSIEGSLTIAPQYKQARSFSNELAPVLLEEGWGYIDRDNEIRIRPEFEEAGSFSHEGVAPVVKNGWQLIKLVK